MGRKAAADRATYDVSQEWTAADKALLRKIEEKAATLPLDAPRALLSVRLSVFNDETTSPVRQELDERQLAVDRGERVVGVASDLGVSAMKVPPWKRKELGAWLNDRVPEFDTIIFWKLDRFIRNLGDLSTMMNWALKYEKNLVSVHDSIDLHSVAGRIMVTVIGGVAEIEAANTRVRVESLWSYTKTQTDWLVGKPPYGYKGKRKDGRTRLVHDPEAVRALERAYDLIVTEKMSATAAVRQLKDEELVPASVTPGTMLRRLRSPALLGHRTEENKSGRGFRRSRSVLDHEGKPLLVGEPIFTQEKYDALQATLDGNSRSQPPRERNVTKFLGVLLCAQCETSMFVHNTQNRANKRHYTYLRCSGCPSGGPGFPHPEQVYERLVQDVLSVMGDYPVETREYAKGEEARAQMQELEEKIAYYMKGLEPGGTYARTRFTREQAEATVSQLVTELEKIDPESADDRWVYVANGLTYRERWEEGGLTAVSHDLSRAGIRVMVTRSREEGKREINIKLRLKIPRDIRDRLIVRTNDFASDFGMSGR